MDTVILLILLTIAPSAPPQPALLPVPLAADLAAAEATVQEVFGADLTGARKPADKAALAQRMLDTATDSHPAERFALFTQARELAIAAKDSAAGVQAAEGLAGFAPETPQDAAQWATDGHRVWNAAEGKRPPEALRLRLEAAECYLRALNGLEGFQRGVVERRLAELGWRRSPIDFNFNESIEGWTAGNDVADLAIKGGCLTGRIIRGDPSLSRRGLRVAGAQCPLIYLRMSITSGGRGGVFWWTEESPRWSNKQYVALKIPGGGDFHEYRLDLSNNPSWTGQTITLIRIDPGDWARDRRKPRTDAFSIDYIRGAKH